MAIMSATYLTVDGELLMETRGGVDTFYVSDPLGNLIQCRDSSGNKTYEAWYWPYGGLRVASGSNPSPWGYVGTLGYYTDDSSHIYVRARTYRPDLARWQTVDPLWPGEKPYIYSRSRPSDRSDPTGLQMGPGGKPCHRNPCTPCSDLIKKDGPGPSDDLTGMINCLKTATNRDDVERCMAKWGGKLAHAAWDQYRDFIACEVANALARSTDVPSLGKGCDPCKSGLQAPDTQWCCYSKFLQCLFACSNEEGNKLTWCIAQCLYVKHENGGFVQCGFMESF